MAAADRKTEMVKPLAEGLKWQIASGVGRTAGAVNVGFWFECSRTCGNLAGKEVFRMIDSFADMNAYAKFKRLDVTDPENIKKLDGMYVDFYLEDDMFEVEGQFFTIDGELYIEVHDSVMHILEMAGKELKVGQIGDVFTATRPDNHRFYMEINRVYYLMENPVAADFAEMYEKNQVKEFFLKLTDVMVKYDDKSKKWSITKNKINMYYVGDTMEYDSVEELFADNKDTMNGTWQAVIYEAYEEESDFTGWL